MRNLTAIMDRSREIYDRLVDETENPDTIHDREKSRTLHLLLDVMEYMYGNEDENPLDEIFGG